MSNNPTLLRKKIKNHTIYHAFPVQRNWFLISASFQYSEQKLQFPLWMLKEPVLKDTGYFNGKHRRELLNKNALKKKKKVKKRNNNLPISRTIQDSQACVPLDTISICKALQILSRKIDEKAKNKIQEQYSVSFQYLLVSLISTYTDFFAGSTLVTTNTFLALLFCILAITRLHIHYI